MVERRTKQFAPSAPRNASGDDSLYEQIAAGDEMAAQASRRRSLIMMLMIEYMRLTLTLDAKRREYKDIFQILGSIWTGFMLCLYVCGLVMFFILLGSYMRFPSYVHEYLDENGILYSDVKVPGYVISRVELYDLHNRENTYHIDRVNISSTFSDFLNRRAKNVSLDGVKLSFDLEKNKAENLLSLVSRLNTSAELENGIGFRIDSLEVSDAVVTLKGKDYEVPISVSLTGIYGRETNIRAFINVNDPRLTVRGPLFVRDSDQGISWDFDVQSGTVILPGRPREVLSGKVQLKTKKNQVRSASADLTMSNERVQKNMTASFEREKNTYRGNVQLKWTDVSSSDAAVERTNMSFDLSGLTFSENGLVQTNRPVGINLSTKYAPDMQVQDLAGSLQGELKCQLPDTCLFDLQKKSVLTSEQMRLPTLGMTLSSTEKTQLTLSPVKNMLSLSLKEGHFKFDLPIKNLRFIGTQFETNTPASFDVDSVRISGDLSLLDKKMMATLSAEDVNYKTQTHDISKAVLTMDDIFNDAGRIYFKSPRVLLKGESYLKVPFSLEMVRQGGVANLTAATENDTLRLIFSGYWNKNSGNIDGQFIIPPVSLEKIQKPYTRISSLIPESIKSASGKVAAYGRLNGSIYGDLNGPLYVALSDVGFRTNNQDVKGINTALSIQSLRPFVTETTQEIFIDRISAIVPIDHVDMTLRLEDKFAQLTGLSAEIAGIPLYAEPTIVPYRSVGTLLYLRSRDTDLSGLLDGLSVKDWTMSAPIQGSVLVPVDIKDLGVTARTIGIQLSKAILGYVGNETPDFLGQNKRMEVQTGTISVDENKDDARKVKISLLLDVMTGGGNTLLSRQVVKKVLLGQIDDFVTFKPVKTTVPTSVRQQIEQVFAQIMALGF